MMDRTNMRDGYKFYRQNHQDADSKTYLEIVSGLMQLFMQKVLEGNDVKMGAKLGTIGVRGAKVEPIITEEGEIRGIAPNWGETKKSWQKKAEDLGISYEEFLLKPRSERPLVYCFNEHSNFIKYKLVWYKANVIVRNKSYYGLGFSWHNRRALSKLIKEGKEYLVIPKKEKK